MKFADDTLPSLLSSSWHHHNAAPQEVVSWCKAFYLKLSVKKTKDMIVTFSNSQRQLAEADTTTIQEVPVEIVQEYRHLGTIFESLSRVSSNTEEILRKFNSICSES